MLPVRDKVRTKFENIPNVSLDTANIIEQAIHTWIQNLVKHQTRIKLSIVQRIYLGKCTQIYNLLNNKSYLSKRVKLPADITTILETHYKTLCKAKWDMLQPDLEMLDKTITHDTSNIYTTTQFQCGSCKQYECIYFELQMRSCDESGTIQVRCLNCGHYFHVG